VTLLIITLHKSTGYTLNWLQLTFNNINARFSSKHEDYILTSQSNLAESINSLSFYQNIKILALIYQENEITS